MNILHIDSSTSGADSVSRAATKAVIDKLTADNPDASVTYRDLGTEPLAHLNPVTTGAIRTPEEHQTDDMKAAAAAERAILDEFLAADTIVIGVPMYNFAIPSNLKSWIDRLGVPRTTFRYTENGPEGLAGGRRVIFAIAAGGPYEPGSQPLSLIEDFLTTMFGFIGITDMTFVRATGVGMTGPEGAIDKAKEDIAKL